MGVGILKGLFDSAGTYQNRVEDSIPGLRCPTDGRLSCEEGLTGSFLSDQAHMSLACGVWAGQMGKGDRSASGTEPESGGGIKLSGRMRRGGPGLLVARVGKPRWLKILMITEGSSMAVRMANGPPHCGHVVRSMAKTRLIIAPSSSGPVVKQRGDRRPGWRCPSPGSPHRGRSETAARRWERVRHGSE
jgi:hypothetical protein